MFKIALHYTRNDVTKVTLAQSFDHRTKETFDTTYDTLEAATADCIRFNSYGKVGHKYLIAPMPAGYNPLHEMSGKQLRQIVKDAVKDHGIDLSWLISNKRTTSVEDMLEHINDLCNEHGITPMANGQLKKI